MNRTKSAIITNKNSFGRQILFKKESGLKASVQIGSNQLPTQRSPKSYLSAARMVTSSSGKIGSGTQIMNIQLTSQDVKESENFDDIIKTRYDDQLKIQVQIKPSSTHSKGESLRFYIQQETVKQIKVRYSSQSKINLTALPVARGTVSIMLNIQKKDYGFNLQNFKKKIPARSKFKMKWKTIQWLLNNRKDAIRQIFQNYNYMLKFARNKKEGMDREEFGELLSFVGLGADPNLADKLFYIFDEDSSGTVDYKELIIGLEVFKEDSIEEKMKVFFDLCDVDGSGNISQKEIYEVLKQNLLNSDDKMKLKKIIAQIFVECDKNGDGVLDKEEVLEAAKENAMLRQLLEESIRNVKLIDQIIENDLEEPFHCWVPVSANFVNYKEGIHFPQMDNVVKAFEEFENIYVKNRLSKISQSRNKQKDNYNKIAEDSFVLEN